MARGFRVHSVRTIDALTSPAEDLAPRAIVLGGTEIAALDWLQTIPLLREAWPLVDVIVWSPHASAVRVRDALRGGVSDVILDRSPGLAAEQVARVIGEQQLLPRTTSESRANAQAGFEGMLSRSRCMHDLFDKVAQVAQSPASVLILGETGTGKELLARAIHTRSRRSGPFVALNCAAVPETLIDSELFGHVAGAFTGATGPKPGLFRHADGGTLLLDEAGNVPLPVQYRLLRVLQENTVRPVGGHTEIGVDVRVIAATSTSLEEDVRAGRFREDLFYRLDVIRLVVPPLRERTDDVVFLFAQFARKFSDSYRLQRPDVTEGFLDMLVSHPWPGNVRQLENFTERLVLTEANRLVTAARFREMVAFQGPDAPVAVERSRLPALDLEQPMAAALQAHQAHLERAYVEGILAKTNGRIGEAAAHAGISRRTLPRLLARLDIDKARFRNP